MSATTTALANGTTGENTGSSSTSTSSNIALSTNHAVLASHHAHPSTGLLVALPLALAILFFVALALFCRRIRFLRQGHSASFYPHVLPPLSHLPATATATRLEDSQPTPSTKPHQERRNLEPNVLATADVFAPSPVHGRGSLLAKTHAPHDDPANVELREGRETGASEPMMSIPWSLGERLLAVLGGRHEWSSNGSTLGSETLPPYEEQDAGI